jgi:eukaryotic-like serine/threonine-protein kinase
MKIRVGDVLNGKYEVERHLARGGMGSIWVARDRKLCRRVAVKFIEFAPTDAADATTIHARFEREALAVARLKSPHVVQVYDQGLDAETPYIVMEYLEGENLARRMAREFRLSFPTAVNIMNQAARGLRAAHEAGIVHRDLKPANIFLADVDHEQVVKILDFGIAKVLDHRSVTVDGEIFGSARYMSPEQIFGAKDLDLRSDLWSMGVILYRAITGSDAFSRDIVETVQSLKLGEYTPATTAASHLVPEVDGFFERALALDRNRRFLSAVEMADAFAEVAKKQAAATTRGLGGAPARRAEESPTSRPEAVAPTDLDAPTEPDAPKDLDAMMEPDAPTPLLAHKVVADVPPQDEGTLSATARETRSAHQAKRSRALVALAAIGVAAAAFALWPRSRPVAADVHSPPAVESVVAPSPAPATPPADPQEPEVVAVALPAPEVDPDADPAPSSSAAEASPPARPAPSAHAPSARASATQRPAPAARPSCDPPYSVDAQGMRHPIKACL